MSSIHGLYQPHIVLIIEIAIIEMQNFHNFLSENCNSCVVNDLDDNFCYFLRDHVDTLTYHTRNYENVNVSFHLSNGNSLKR